MMDNESSIPEIRLVPQAETPEARRALGFEWNEICGTRHKLGGTPDWIQQPNVPDCPGCRQSMVFYGQLDSIGDDVNLADCGMIYVFVCFDCFHCASVLQSY